MSMHFKMVVFSFLSFLIVSSGAAHAGETGKEHGHKTPHGGIVREAEGMHVEFMIDKSGQPKLYLYDKDMKPLERSNLEAKLTVKEHDSAQHTRVLKFSKDGKDGPFFTGEPIKGIKDWDTAVVSLKLKDQWHHVRFSHH
jgi:hypothetical protein